MDARHSASSGRVWSRESIALILRHHLDIPEERFFKMDLEEFNRRQRDAAYTRGVSWDPWRLLLVCKTWRAVGEPLLYHTIVVRTQPQAQTLMETFRGNAALAPYIRRLRLEGAFGLAGSQVLHFASATAVDVWLHITHADGDRILVHPQGVALSWINPRRVAIHDDLDNPARFGEPMRELVSQALRRWSHLRHITYSLEDARGAYARAIAHNLAGSTTLEILEIPEGSAPSLALLILGTTPPTLRKVIVHGPLSDEISSWLSSQLPTVIMDCRLPLNARPAFKRQFPAEIIDMIVGFALEDRPKRMRMGVTRWYDQALALHLLVVSAQVKEFTLAHLCRRPYFNDATNLAKFTNLLRSRDDLIQRVIAVDLAFGRNFGPYRDTYHSSDTNRELADMMSVNYFLATMRNLRRVSISCTAAQNGFIALAPWVLDTLGSLRHLEELSGVSIGSMRGDATEVSSTTLARLRLLRKLVNTQWVSPLCLNESAPWSSIFTNLCALEIRQMPHGTTPPVLWGHLEVMELPLLHTFGYPVLDLAWAGAFLKKHGATLTSLAFSEYKSITEDRDASLSTWCPSLTQIEFWDRLDRAVEHTGVRRVVLNIRSESHLRDWLSTTDDDGEVLPFVPFAKLREMQNHAVDDDWGLPNWRAVSDELRMRNIIMLSRSGEAWRPRLKRSQNDGVSGGNGQYRQY